MENSNKYVVFIEDTFGKYLVSYCNAIVDEDLEDCLFSEEDAEKKLEMISDDLGSDMKASVRLFSSVEHYFNK